jgi:hypothetical protein
MKKYPVVRVCWFAVNVLLTISLGAILYSATWEFSTQSYLKGFSDAIIPASDTPVQKIEAILAWMSHGPARRVIADPGVLAERNPEDTLNIEQLLRVCGTATNAFVNLAQSGGLHARRLLLLSENRTSKHVVVEVLIDDRWVVVDPSYRSFLRLPNGRLLTRDELQNPVIFRAATQDIPNYPQSYTYERTVHVRMRKIPMVGTYLRRILDYVWPAWETTINWTLLVERESFAMLVASSLLLCFALVLRLFLGWYCSRRLGIPRIRLRDQIKRAGQVLVGYSQ